MGVFWSCFVFCRLNSPRTPPTEYFPLLILQITHTREMREGRGGGGRGRGELISGRMAEPGGGGGGGDNGGACVGVKSGNFPGQKIFHLHSCTVAEI